MLPFYQMRSEKIFGHTCSNPHFPPHMHIQLEMFYIREGECEITVNQQTRLMKKGDLAIVFPNCIHSRETSLGSAALTITVVAVKPEMAGDFSNTILHYTPENSFLSAEQVPEEAVHALLQLYEISREPADDRSEAAYRSVLIKSYLQIILALGIPYLRLAPNTLKAHTLIQRSVNYIMQNFDQPQLSLESVAKAVGATRNHLSAAFSRQLKVGFNQYLNSVRLNYAQDMMRNTDRSITQIAFACGFGTLRTFNRVFKRYYHITPSQFRALSDAEAANIAASQT